MAHSAMHLGIGLTAGAVSGLPFLRAAFREDAPRNAATWLAISYALGAVAVFPSFLGMIGVPESITTGWYMNIFLFHPLIDRLKAGGALIGEVLIVSCFVFQYFLMLMLLRNTIEKRKRAN